ncbi:hypothetical protein C0W59_21595 [Photobacterium kishitanii]|uniref:hypothetical protein n=1 Tax=Photobacterium kishitanii TaxID=318456 RepID=UPI000D15C463|nr:hypothetical protein [Photobacterium kishitanii]PSV10004.1 hypothetical protein C0W59_21595 [Photobacterium kishitanii]
MLYYKWIIQKLLLVAFAIFSNFVFSANVAISRGDTYIALVPILLNKSNVYAGASGNAGVCFGFGSKTNTYKCELEKKYDKNGVNIIVNYASTMMKSDHSGAANLTINNGISNCSPSNVECNSDWQPYYMFKENFAGYGGSYDIIANLDSVSITAAKNAIPGEYIVPVSVSAIDGNWVTTTKDLKITVRDATCTITNDVINIGTIIPGQMVTEKINLKLNCDSILAGASWKYFNINGGSNTNLKNVSIKIKNRMGEVINNNTLYSNINELNDLSLEIIARSNAEGGHLNVPLRFTLTYS